MQAPHHQQQTQALPDTVGSTGNGKHPPRSRYTKSHSHPHTPQAAHDSIGAQHHQQKTQAQQLPGIQSPIIGTLQSTSEANATPHNDVHIGAQHNHEHHDHINYNASDFYDSNASDFYDFDASEIYIGDASDVCSEIDFSNVDPPRSSSLHSSYTHRGMQSQSHKPKGVHDRIEAQQQTPALSHTFDSTLNAGAVQHAVYEDNVEMDLTASASAQSKHPPHISYSQSRSQSQPLRTQSQPHPQPLLTFTNPTRTKHQHHHHEHAHHDHDYYNASDFDDFYANDCSQDDHHRLQHHNHKHKLASQPQQQNNSNSMYQPRAMPSSTTVTTVRRMANHQHGEGEGVDCLQDMSDEVDDSRHIHVLQAAMPAAQQCPFICPDGVSDQAAFKMKLVSSRTPLFGQNLEELNENLINHVKYELIRIMHGHVLSMRTVKADGSLTKRSQATVCVYNSVPDAEPSCDDYTRNVSHNACILGDCGDAFDAWKREPSETTWKRVYRLQGSTQRLLAHVNGKHEHIMRAAEKEILRLLETKPSFIVALIAGVRKDVDGFKKRAMRPDGPRKSSWGSLGRKRRASSTTVSAGAVEQYEKDIRAKWTNSEWLCMSPRDESFHLSSKCPKHCLQSEHGAKFPTSQAKAYCIDFLHFHLKKGQNIDLNTQ